MFTQIVLMASLKWLIYNPIKDNARVTFSLELTPAGVLRGDLALQTLTRQLVGTATLCWLIGMPGKFVLMWGECLVGCRRMGKCDGNNLASASCQAPRLDLASLFREDSSNFIITQE